MRTKGIKNNYSTSNCFINKTNIRPIKTGSKALSILIVTWFVLSSFFTVMMYNTDSEVYAATISSTGTKPINGEIITGKYTFEVNDAGDSSKCEFRIDGLLIATMDDTGIGNPDWNYTLDTSGFTDGSHLIRYDSIGGATGDDIITIPVKFDNNGPIITNATTLYPQGQVFAKPSDEVTVIAKIVEPVTSILSVTCDATLIGGGSAETMYDDGLHNDGAPNDDVFGTALITVNSTGGYWAAYVHATDSQNNLRNETAPANVDIYEPTILEIEAMLPAGQTAVKNGDQIRITAKALDYKVVISDKVQRKPLDVVLVLDNSGSMRNQPWADLETASTTFIDTLADNDRCAVVSFDAQGDPEAVKQYSTFLTMSETYNDPQGSAYTSSGRNVSKYIITRDDGLHLTKWRFGGYQPGCWTTIWDAIGKGIQYAINSRRTDAVPVVIAMTDGDDWGSPNNQEYGSETYCPGAPNGATGRTWAVSGGCIWNSPDRAYSSVQRENDNNQFNALTTISFGPGSAESTRTGLINASIPVYTIGLNIAPQGTNSSAPNYLIPSANSYKYSTEFDLWSIANSSINGKYYYAPQSNQLEAIYQNVSQSIQKFGVTTLGQKQPHGIASVQADLSSIGITLKVNMFDDGEHGDAKPFDSIYGSDPITVNSINSANIVFKVEGTDKAGNVNGTQFTIELDNTQPTVSSVTTVYPANRSKAQDGYSIYVEANCSDSETGLGSVFLDATNIGGGDKVPMVDDGTGNDYRAFDGFYTSKNVTLATGLVSGIYTYKVNAYDRATNEGSQSGNIDIYNDVDINMGNLIEDDVISGIYQIIANITDIDGVPDTDTNPRYRIDANPWHNMSLSSGTDFVASINTTEYLEGPHSLYVNAKDTFGAQSTIEVKFKIDNTPPNQLNVISPIPNEYIEGIYSFRCIATDEIGIKNVTLSISNETGYIIIENGTMGYNSGSGYYEYVFGSAGFPDGFYNVTLVANDFAGHQKNSGNLTFQIDNTDPTITLIHPQNGRFVYGMVIFNASIDEMYLDKVEYNIDDSGWVNISVPWNTTSLDDGSHSIKIRAIDHANHEVVISISVIVDNNYPVCILTQPAQFRYIEDIFTLRSYVSDQVGVKQVKMTINKVTKINASNSSVTEVLNSTMGYNAGTGYYEYVFDTTVMLDGNYTINITAEDTAGNITATGDIIFYIDNYAPELSILDPLKGDLISGLFAFNVSINETFLDWVRYNIDGSGWVDITTLWDTTLVTDGAHEVTIRVRDRAGHVSEEAISVIVDNNNPICNILSPVVNQYIENFFTFRIGATDKVKIDRVTISVFNETVNATYNTQTSSYEYTVDTTVYGDGSRFVSAIAYDSSGKMGQSIPILFHVDNHAPVLTIESPLDGQFVWGEIRINVTIMEIFPGPTEYNVDGKGWIGIGVPWDTTVLSDGRHVLQVRATDKLGHETIQTMEVIVDNNDPVCIIQTPIENQYIEDTFTFRIIALDDVGVDSVVLSLFYGEINAIFNSQTGYYEFTVDTSFFEDGEYNVSAFCIDIANRTNSSKIVNFRIDNEFPILQVNAPKNGQFVSGEVEISLVITDAFPSITEYSIDGTGWIPYQINPFWNSTSVTDGEHTLDIRCTDPSGHTAMNTVILKVDNNAPICALHSPAENQFVEGTFTFKILVQDEVGIDHVKLELFGSTVSATYNSQTNYYEFTKVLSDRLDGVYNITITAFDKSGKSTTIGPINFSIDNDAPIISIDSSIPNGFLSGVQPINVVVEDAFETVTEYNVDGSGWVSTIIPWNTRLNRDGEHTITIRAMDEAGHVVEQEITVFVDNNAPKISMVLPRQYEYISGSFTIKAYAADTFGVESVILYIDGGSPREISQNPSTGLYELPLDTTNPKLEDGLHEITVEAFDKSFLTSNTTIKFYVDNTPPEIGMDYPKKGKGQVEFVVNGTDLSGIDTILINIDGSGWRELNQYEGINDTFRYIWRTTKKDNGYHIFDVKVIDILGNEATASGSLKIDNKEEFDYLGMLLDLLPLIVFIVIIILIIIVFTLMRRGTFSAWMGRVQTRFQSREKETDSDLNEDLDAEDEFEFEFANSGNDEDYTLPENNSKLEEKDIDWFEEEQPPSVIPEEQQGSFGGAHDHARPRPHRTGARKARKTPMAGPGAVGMDGAPEDRRRPARKVRPRRKAKPGSSGVHRRKVKPRPKSIKPRKITDDDESEDF
jgi:hypothetical protein